MAGGDGRILILTGAGISAESGLGTFRDPGGLWERVDLRRLATPDGYRADPGAVLAFYNARRAQAAAAEPNAAHRAIARLQAACPGRITLVTQNIDDLHERAGSAEVIHMHGALARALCAACAHRWAWAGDMGLIDACPACGRRAAVRPDVVWFGEIPYEMERIAEALERATLFVAIGTSGAVYPAAGFVAEAAARGAATLEINLAPSDTSGQFGSRRLGPASETVPAWVETVLAGGPA